MFQPMSGWMALSPVISTFDTAMWSGNTNGTSWSAEETPELIVTLKADDFCFFDSSF